MTHPLQSTARQIRNLEALLKVSKMLGSEIELESLLNLILEITTEVMEAERTSLFLYDEETKELWSKVAQGIDSREIRFSINLGIAGEVARTVKLANIPNAYLDHRFNPEFDRKSDFKTHAVLCFPMVNPSGKLAGVIQVINKKWGGAFTSEDETLLGALSVHLVVALERIKMIELYAEQQRMDQSLKLAHEIQLSMLPHKFPPFPSKVDALDIFAYIDPVKEIGGDLYDFFLIDEDHLCFAIGDVSDKGIPAALFMAIVDTALKTTTIKDLNPADIVTQMNLFLFRYNSTGMFCSFFCGILNLKSGKLDYCNAGHPPPYILRRTGCIDSLKEPHGFILGILENAKFTLKSLVLEKGDGIFLYTDGINEAHDKDFNQYSYEKIEEVLQVSMQLSAKEIVKGVIADINAFVNKTPQSDDITAMMIRYTNGKPVG